MLVRGRASGGTAERELRGDGRTRGYAGATDAPCCLRADDLDGGGAACSRTCDIKSRKRVLAVGGAGSAARETLGSTDGTSSTADTAADGRLGVVSRGPDCIAWSASLPPHDTLTVTASAKSPI